MDLKKRKFSPTEIIFSCTTSCNLHCKHCFIDRKAASLNASQAIAFLETVANSQINTIEKIGFSGGEPFLCSDFLCTVIEKAVNLDFMFDRIMTNGDWWKTEESLVSELQKIYDSGYDGKIGLSYDSFHGQSEERIKTFIESVWKIFGNDSLEIQSVKDEGGLSKDSEKNLSDIQNKIQSLSRSLNLTYEENIFENGCGLVSLSDQNHFLPVFIQKESYQSEDERSFKDSKWFKDDFCQGPGQILYIHANKKIAPCCGFANENKELFIGSIDDSFDEVMKKAEENEMIKICFEEGLSKQIKVFENEKKLAGRKTEDICTFCDWLCKNQKKLD